MLPPVIIDPIGHVTQIYFPHCCEAGRLPQFPCLSCFYGNPSLTVLAEKPSSRQPLRSPSSFQHCKKRTLNLLRSWGEAGTELQVTKRSVGGGRAFLALNAVCSYCRVRRGIQRYVQGGWVIENGASSYLCYVFPYFQVHCSRTLEREWAGGSLHIYGDFLGSLFNDLVAKHLCEKEQCLLHTTAWIAKLFFS